MLLTTAAAVPALAELVEATRLQTLSSRDRKVVRRYALPGEPRGLTAAPDGLLYVGLAGPQAVAAVDPADGTVLRRVVLDDAEIASTKELVTLRTTHDGTRLVIANGSDESASILSLPDLGVLREITMEGEAIRDALPDPGGRHLYLLGRRVHVFDGAGDALLRSLPVDDPMAIAASADGKLLAVLAPEDFGNARATVVFLFETDGFSEVARDPLQTEERIESAFFGDGGRVLVAFSSAHRFETSLFRRPAPAMTREGTTGAMRMTIGFGDLVNSDRICLSERSGPQIAALTSSDRSVVFAERRCSQSGAFSGSARRMSAASIYGIDAYALAFHAPSGTVAATDPEGFLTIYHAPKETPAADGPGDGRPAARQKPPAKSSRANG